MIQTKSDDWKIFCEELDSTVALITHEKLFSADWKVKDRGQAWEWTVSRGRRLEPRLPLLTFIHLSELSDVTASTCGSQHVSDGKMTLKC